MEVKALAKVAAPGNWGVFEVEAAGGFEPPHGGFADLSLNHLGMPPES